MLNKDYNQHPDVGPVGDETRECGPLDASDLQERLSKQYPAVTLDRATPGVKAGDNAGQNAAHAQQNGPLDSTYTPRSWGGDSHKKGSNAKNGQGLLDDWRTRRESVNAGERAAIGRANVPRKA